jgi:hypothetical protein
LEEVPSAFQINKDACAMYGKLFNACQGGVGIRHLMEKGNKQDVIRALYQLVDHYEINGGLENVITTVFHRN